MSKAGGMAVGDREGQGSQRREDYCWWWLMTCPISKVTSVLNLPLVNWPMPLVSTFLDLCCIYCHLLYISDRNMSLCLFLKHSSLDTSMVIPLSLMSSLFVVFKVWTWDGFLTFTWWPARLCVAHKAIKWESPVTNETEISPWTEVSWHVHASWVSIIVHAALASLESTGIREIWCFC